MALAEKYVYLFKKECFDLSKIVLHNLNLLKENPNDYYIIEKIIQAADTMIGDSRFINHKKLENASMLLVKTFNQKENVLEKSEIEFFINLFSTIKKDQL